MLSRAMRCSTESFAILSLISFCEIPNPQSNCRWPDSNRHGPITAQRILSPLRLPFRHIGAVLRILACCAAHENKFPVADLHRSGGAVCVARVDEKPSAC